MNKEFAKSAFGMGAPAPRKDGEQFSIMDLAMKPWFGVIMICEECEHLEFRNKYKIVCKVHEHLLLDVKQCQNFKKKDEK